MFIQTKASSKAAVWNFDSTLAPNGFHVIGYDGCVYSEVDKHGCVIICLDVDDIHIFGTKLDVVNGTKSFLVHVFTWKTWKWQILLLISK